MIYLNSILIYSNTMFTHYWHIKKVLKQLCKASFYTKVEKYKFYSELVEYLRYILDLLCQITKSRLFRIGQN